MMINSSFVPLGHQKMEGINTLWATETIFILRFSPESYECCAVAGLLACSAFDDLPVPLMEQWLKKDQKYNGTHSIGECSGFSPDSLSIRPRAEPMHMAKIRGGSNKSK